MARRAGRNREKVGKRKDTKKVILLGIAIFCLLGVFTVDEIAGRIFFAFGALISGLFWSKRNEGMKTQNKSVSDQPGQQFQPHLHNASVQQFSMEPRQTPSPLPQGNQSDRQSEFRDVSPSRLSNQLPSLPQNINGIPAAYQYQENNIAMPGKYVRDFYSINVGDPIVFQLEPENEYDAKAIQLWSNNQMLGYVFRGRLQDILHDFIKRDEPVYAMVFSVNPQEQKVTYSVAFYRHPEPKFLGKHLATGRLTASAGEEAQENITLCDVGDELSVDYDYEKERYEVSSTMGYVGCLPKKLEQHGESAAFVVEELGETDAGKSYVVVGVYSSL